MARQEYINFILNGMTFLRYSIPLTIEASSRGIKSRYFIHATAKDSSPFTDRNYKIINEYSKIYNFEIFESSRANDFEGTFFLIEGTGLEYLSEKHKKISITYMTDFHSLYPKYIDKVDNVIFPSEHMARYYDTISPKNLYLGSPKYDMELDEKEILDKYNIPDLKNILIVAPKMREAVERGEEVLAALRSYAHAANEMGHRLLIKTRKKDRFNTEKFKKWFGNICEYMYFEDESWYQHTTMELIKVSKLALNFGSTTIKECVMLDTPVINFDIKPQIRHGKDLGKYRLGMSYLYDQKYCYNATSPSTNTGATIALSEMMSNDWSSEFSKARKKYLFEGNSSKRILDYLEKV